MRLTLLTFMIQLRLRSQLVATALYSVLSTRI
nr:MAG TPA_asm: hypothetical protein [Bacteriophage sp.]